MVDRKKDKKHPEKELPYNVEVKFFGINNPHLTDEVPVSSMEYENIHRIIIRGFEINFLPRGADILINNVGKVNVEHDPHGHVMITKV